VPDYYGSELRSRRLPERFPEWALGSHLWREYGNQVPAKLRGLFDALILLRLSANWGTWPLQRPRLFVSHRQADEPRAREIAVLARAVGFQVWLDAEDALLATIAAWPVTLTGAELAILVAATIETALLNSTHVIAVITTKASGSKWVPYEYGRAKDSSMYSLQAGCWLDADIRDNDVGEYMGLGQTTRSDAEITAWLKAELAVWNQQFGPCPSGTETADRVHTDTTPMTEGPQLEADLDDMVHQIMTGLDRPIVVRGPLKFKTNRA
jgi:hypothetical protein